MVFIAAVSVVNNIAKCALIANKMAIKCKNTTTACGK
jgi:hypothetical protein